MLFQFADHKVAQPCMQRIWPRPPLRFGLRQTADALVGNITVNPIPMKAAFVTASHNTKMVEKSSVHLAVHVAENRLHQRTTMPVLLVRFMVLQYSTLILL